MQNDANNGASEPVESVLLTKPLYKVRSSVE